MTMTLSTQLTHVLLTFGPPLLALAPAGAAALVAMPAARALRAAPARRRVIAALALAAGVLLALAAVMMGPLPAQIRLDALFVPSGWWDIGAVELLSERIPEALRAAPSLIATPLAALPADVRVVALGFLVAALLMLAATLAERRLGDSLVDMAAGAALIAVSAALGVYAVCVLLWLAAYLNYWVFLVLLFGMQRWRHGAI